MRTGVTFTARVKAITRFGTVPKRTVIFRWTTRFFPATPQTAFLFACEPNLAFIFDLDRGSSFEELEEAPEFGDQRAGKNIEANPPVF